LWLFALIAAYFTCEWDRAYRYLEMRALDLYFIVIIIIIYLLKQNGDAGIMSDELQ